jgi:hypothetical protein
MVYTPYMDPIASKQNHYALLVLGGVIVLTLLAGLVPAKWFGIKPSGPHYSKIDLSNPDSIADLATDTNGDGAVDWKEIIQQTYSGTTADIEASKAATLDPQTLAALNDPNNLTGNLSKNFYIASAYFKEVGLTDSGAQGGVAQNLIQDAASRLAFKTYELSDILVDRSESSASVKTYGNQMGALMKKGLTARLGVGDTALFQTYIEKKDVVALADLESKKSEAKDIVASLQTIHVPLSAAAFHLLILNRLSAYEETLDNMLKVQTDPARSTIALSQYIDVTSDMLSAARLLVSYFESKDVVFSPKDAGYVFDPSYTVK